MKDGINAGDPLIDILKEKLDERILDYKLTSLSGAKKGDGDIHIKCGNVALDGKYKYDPPKHPKFSLDDLLKIKNQAENHTKHGGIVTNTQNGIFVCFDIETFLDILSELNNP